MLLKQFFVFKKPFQRPLGYRSRLYIFIVVFIVKFFEGNFFNFTQTNISWDYVRSRSVQPFWRLSVTNKQIYRVQTDKQSKYTNWFVWKINTYCGKWNCRITKIISIKLQFSSPFLFAIGTGELGTSERNTFNHDLINPNIQCGHF